MTDTTQEYRLNHLELAKIEELKLQQEIDYEINSS